ncbi:MAG: hypothetical protein LBM65_03220 [Oscillospiraceae bacterium]|nr:hypothetical protein [Oscillospiraceae bacterium]
MPQTNINIRTDESLTAFTLEEIDFRLKIALEESAAGRFKPAKEVFDDK